MRYPNHYRKCSTALFCLFFLLVLSITGCRHRQTNDTTESTSGIIDFPGYEKYKHETLPDSLVDDIQQLRETSKADNEFETFALTSIILANRCAHLNDYQAGITVMDEFIDHVTNHTTADSTVISNAYYSTGEFYYNTGATWIAQDYFIRSAECANTDKERCRAQYAIGISLSNNLEASRGLSALECFESAEKVAQSIGDSSTVAHALFGQAQLYLDFMGVHQFKDEWLTTAKKDSIHQAIKLLEKAHHYQPFHVLDYALGLSYAALKNFDRAQYYIDRSTAGAYADSAQSLNVKASLLICMERYPEAIHTALEAYGISNRTNNKGDIRKSLHILYYAYKYSGHTDRALDVFEQFAEQRQGMMDLAFEQRVNISQVRYDTQLKQEQLLVARTENAAYRKTLIITITGLVIILTLLVVIVSLYRKTLKAHRALVKRTQQWALIPDHILPVDSETADEVHTSDNNEQKELIKKLNDFMKENKAHMDARMNLNTVTEQLGTNRTYLSSAINSLYGYSFTIYLNEYRIKEAVNILSDKNKDKHTIDAVAAMVGFSNRITFYRAFMRSTGLSPTEFRKNRS